MQFVDVLAHFDGVGEHADGGYLAVCPAHDDSRPSLRIWRGDDNKVRLTCRAGCDTDAVRSAAGLEWSDLFNASGDGATVPAAKPAVVGIGHTASLAAYVVRASAEFHNAASQVGRDALAYALDRFGIDAEHAEELLLGADDGMSVPNFAYRSRAFTRFPRLVVPLVNFVGTVHGLQGRDLSGACPGRWVSLTNPDMARWGAYGVFRGHGGYGVTLVTEGPGDALTAVSVGYDALAIRGAALAGSPELIAELAEGLKGSQVIVCGDLDSAGSGFSQRLAEGLARFGIQVFTIDLPQGLGKGGDLTDWRMWRRETFAAELHAAVKAARPNELATAAKQGEILSARTGTDTVSADQGKDAAAILGALLERYGDSDAMNAHALVAWSEGRIRYAAGLGYFVWNGRVWERSDVKVRQEIHRMGAALVLAGKTHEARGFTMTSRIDDLMTELRSVPSVHVHLDDFDAQRHLLSFRNGTVDLRSGVLRPHDKADLMTYCLDLDFRPEATCPRWDGFLTEIFPGAPELAAYMQRLTGYGITGNVDEQCFAVLWGKGANGKSVLTDTLTSVFSRITVTTPFATFEDKPSGGIPNDLAALRGSRLVMASEGEAGKLMSEAVLKRITGKDRVTARFLRQEFFSFSPTFLIMLATNHKPKFKSQDEGLWRRVKLIPFTRYFAPHERDYDLDRKLLAEAEGIAAWAVRGAVEWYQNGLGDPDCIVDATKEYRATEDAMAGFFPGIIEPADDSERISGADAFNRYLEWCEDENLPQKERWTRRAFYSYMEERGVTRRKMNTGIALIGVRFAAPPAPVTGPGIFGG
jgi:putative DNA primase/helicase